MMELGKMNKLEVFRESPHGMYLMDDEGEEVLLPNKYVPEDIQIDDDIEVFVYLDSEERPVATTLTPKVMLNQFAALKVMDVTEIGAFMDMGLEKHLFVPFREQNRRMKVGEIHIIYMYLDEETDRLVGSSKYKKRLRGSEAVTLKEGDDITLNWSDGTKLKEGQEVQLLIAEETPIGFNAIINQLCLGLLYKNEVFKNIKTGSQPKGYIKKIREDGKIDLSLQPIGYAKVEPNAEKILDKLRWNNGYIRLNDKSEPDEIRAMFQMSKKTFKKAIGALYKQRLIVIENHGIRLVE